MAGRYENYSRKLNAHILSCKQEAESNLEVRLQNPVPQCSTSSNKVPPPKPPQTTPQTEYSPFQF